MEQRKQIVFVHPDLGIGGAERLVVDAALALKSKGHRVCFVTGHHDKKHCFEETKNGTLFVSVVANWIPRQLFGRFHAFLAYLRMFVIALYLVTLSNLKPDVIFCDQVSVGIPILKLFTKAKIIFYCHFPDQLLTKRRSFIKWLYRQPLDWIEEKTTGMADMLLVNSHFTAEIFRETFKSLHDLETHVLHPSLNTEYFDKTVKNMKRERSEDIPFTAKFIFLSVNRFERKKNLSLAIKALAELRDHVTPAEWLKVHLVVAGGYDKRVIENVRYHEELLRVADKKDLKEKVTFLRSISDQKKLELYRASTAVIYTPANEHFGIVPIESMYMRRPVIAANSGGPLETIDDGNTGFLREPTAEKFSQAMLSLIKDDQLSLTMGEKGRSRVNDHFSFKKFSETLNGIVMSIVD